MAQAVVGLFSDYNKAQQAMEALMHAGFAKDQIHLSRDENREGTPDADSGDSSISRFFKSLFSDDNDERSTNADGNDRIVVSVHAETKDGAQMAAQLLLESGALNVKEDNAIGTNTRNKVWENGHNPEKHYEAYQPKATDDTGSRSGFENRNSSNTDSSIVSHPTEKNGPLHTENVRAEKNPMDGDFDETGLQSFQEGTLELSERKEIPIVNKEARIVEEIRIQKERTERDETVHENLRETRVDINDVREQEFKNKNQLNSDSDLDYNIQKGYRVENKNAQQTREDNDKY